MKFIILFCISLDQNETSSPTEAEVVSANYSNEKSNPCERARLLKVCIRKIHSSQGLECCVICSFTDRTAINSLISPSAVCWWVRYRVHLIFFFFFQRKCHDKIIIYEAKPSMAFTNIIWSFEDRNIIELFIS